MRGRIPCTRPGEAWGDLPLSPAVDLTGDGRWRPAAGVRGTVRARQRGRPRGASVSPCRAQRAGTAGPHRSCWRSRVATSAGQRAADQASWQACRARRNDMAQQFGHARRHGAAKRVSLKKSRRLILEILLKKNKKITYKDCSMPFPDSGKPAPTVLWRVPSQNVNLSYATFSVQFGFSPVHNFSRFKHARLLFPVFVYI